MRSADSSEKTLMLGKIEDRRRRVWQMIRCLGSMTNLMDMTLNKLGSSGGQKSLECYSPWGHKESNKTSRLNSNNNDIFTNIG